MRRIFTFFLSSLFLSTIFLFAFPQKVHALCYEIKVDPSVISTTDQTTVSFSVPAPFRPKDYRVNVYDPGNNLTVSRNGTTTREQIGGIWQGKSQETIGPFSGIGDYRVDILSKDPSETNFQLECFTSFSVFDASAGGTCPPYTGTQPSSPTASDSVALTFATFVNTEHTVIIDQDPNKVYRILTGNKSVNIGTYSDGSHSFDLAYSTLSGSVYCYTRQFDVTTGGGGGGNGGGGGTSQCSGFINCLAGISVPGLSGFSETGLIGQFISKFLPAVLTILGFMTIIFIVISGIQFVISGGNPEAAAAARSRLVAALVGFIIILLAFAFLQLIDKIFLGTTGIV